jgi:hypothetical protein
MARFYFHVHDPTESSDEEGLELAGVEAAMGERFAAQGRLRPRRR